MTAREKPGLVIILAEFCHWQIKMKHDENVMSMVLVTGLLVKLYVEAVDGRITDITFSSSFIFICRELPTSVAHSYTVTAFGFFKYHPSAVLSTPMSVVPVLNFALVECLLPQPVFRFCIRDNQKLTFTPYTTSLET